jgi:hypothetical protein
MDFVVKLLHKYVPISSYYFVEQTGTIFDLCLTGMGYGGAEVNHADFLLISNRCRVGVVRLLRRKQNLESNIKDLQTIIHV